LTGRNLKGGPLWGRKKRGGKKPIHKEGGGGGNIFHDQTHTTTGVRLIRRPREGTKGVPFRLKRRSVSSNLLSSFKNDQAKKRVQLHENLGQSCGRSTRGSHLGAESEKKKETYDEWEERRFQRGRSNHFQPCGTEKSGKKCQC